jgi:hypothetical protein
MGDAAARFFDDLASRGQHLLPDKYEGTIRFDLTDHEQTDHWVVSIHRGNVAVARDMTEADCVLHASQELFERLTTGKEHMLPLIMRGAFVIEGDLFLLTAFRKLLPGPPGAHHPRDLAPTRRQST